jgi:hypothetical protein
VVAADRSAAGHRAATTGGSGEDNVRLLMCIPKESRMIPERCVVGEA